MRKSLEVLFLYPGEANISCLIPHISLILYTFSQSSLISRYPACKFIYLLKLLSVAQNPWYFHGHAQSGENVESPSRHVSD